MVSSKLTSIEYAGKQLRRNLTDLLIDKPYISKDDIEMFVKSAETGKPLYKGLGDKKHRQLSPMIEIVEKDKTIIASIDDPMKLRLGGRYSTNIIESEVPFYVSAMSTGSLKVPFKIALHMAMNRLYEEYGIRMMYNTGEGGALPWEIYGRAIQNGEVSREKYQELVSKSYFILDKAKVEAKNGFVENELFKRHYWLGVQIASGRFWDDPEYLAFADFINWKGAQGAKIGHGGTVLAAKVDEIMKLLRGIEMGQDAFSPSRQPDVLGPEDLVLYLWLLREITGWRTPITVKIGNSRVYNDTKIILKALTDGMIGDGFIAGTGAAPYRVQHDIGIHTEPGIFLANKAVADFFRDNSMDDADKNFAVWASGGIADDIQIYKTIAMGAKGTGIGTGWMGAAGCKYARTCHTPSCPADLTGFSRKTLETKVSQFNLELGANKLVNYALALRNSLRNMMSTRPTIDDLVTDQDEISAFSDMMQKDGKTYAQKKKEDIIQILDLEA